MNRTMRKMRKMAQRHRPIAKATNPFWQSQRFAEAPIVFNGIAVTMRDPDPESYVWVIPARKEPRP